MQFDWLKLAAFVGGIFAEFFLLLDLSKDRWKTLLLSLGVILFASVLTEAGSPNGISAEPGFYVVIWGFIFCTIIPVFLKDKITPNIDERTLLIVNAMVLYLVFKSNFSSPVLYFYLLMTGVTLLNALVRIKIAKYLKVALFVWYYILIITIPIAHFNIQMFLDIALDKFGLFSYADLAALGAIYFLIMVHIMYLAWISPLGGSRHESALKMEQRMHENLVLLDSRYDDTQLSVLQALVIICILAILLGANYYYAFVSDSTILIISLLTAGIWHKISSNTPQTSGSIV
ncbi:MAG: hypothetical protein A2538_03260 [Candidatus Magasanikbacteria bacterium RIFOXYD2_FULL_41_14]|uniref:Uncharacterized protein n=1 Tax=Candidatus Magasanikbacteria bacterium RIFOXYD2_FULL_41_14 TaxID=1798709 RepID=A0A1F6PD30_9BACT|nr:MAG: hypothetical protein A2538_03260 [Candidatus Magasanikbacteria bacterium RIFOXYD2_FULL_41_14]